MLLYLGYFPLAFSSWQMHAPHVSHIKIGLTYLLKPNWKCIKKLHLKYICLHFRSEPFTLANFISRCCIHISNILSCPMRIRFYALRRVLAKLFGWKNIFSDNLNTLLLLRRTQKCLRRPKATEIFNHVVSGRRIELYLGPNLHW